MKRYEYIAALLSVSIFITACTGSAEANNLNDNNDTSVTSDDVSQETSADEQTDASSLFSDRDLSGDYDVEECEYIRLSDEASTSDSTGVTIDQNTVTITKEGDYLLEGSLSDGMIIVDTDKSAKVQLILNGVSINSETSAAIYVRQADKVFVTLADGTANTLTNGGTFTAIDDNNIDAVIFSKDDLTLNGSGSVVMTSPAGHGVVSKDDLVITGGNYEIDAASHGLSGKDSVAIGGGSFAITAGKDAIHSENDEDDTAGKVFITDGNFLLNAESDGISAMNEISISGGKLVIEKSYEGIEAGCINISGGEIEITSSDDGLNATDKRTTTAGESRGAQINIYGGIISIDSEGDGIDSNGYLTVSGGEVYVAGPASNGNGALDYGIDAIITGGIVVAAGQSGMAQNFGSDSTQGVILVTTQQQNEAGSDIVLLDSDGSELLSWNMGKRYNSVVVSCPEIVDGGSYTLKTGETATEITMEGLIYGAGSLPAGGMRGGMERRGNKMNGEMPEPKEGEMPEPKGGARPEPGGAEQFQ